MSRNCYDQRIGLVSNLPSSTTASRLRFPRSALAFMAIPFSKPLRWQSGRSSNLSVKRRNHSDWYDSASFQMPIWMSIPKHWKQQSNPENNQNSAVFLCLRTERTLRTCETKTFFKLELPSEQTILHLFRRRANRRRAKSAVFSSRTPSFRQQSHNSRGLLQDCFYFCIPDIPFDVVLQAF